MIRILPTPSFCCRSLAVMATELKKQKPLPRHTHRAWTVIHVNTHTCFIHLDNTKHTPRQAHTWIIQMHVVDLCIVNMIKYIYIFFYTDYLHGGWFLRVMTRRTDHCEPVLSIKQKQKRRGDEDDLRDAIWYKHSIFTSEYQLNMKLW